MREPSATVRKTVFLTSLHFHCACFESRLFAFRILPAFCHRLKLGKAGNIDQRGPLLRFLPGNDLFFVRCRCLFQDGTHLKYRPLDLFPKGHPCNLFQLDTVKSSKDLVTAARRFKVHISEPGLGRRESGVFFGDWFVTFFRDIFFGKMFSGWTRARESGKLRFDVFRVFWDLFRFTTDVLTAFCVFCHWLNHDPIISHHEPSCLFSKLHNGEECIRCFRQNSA